MRDLDDDVNTDAAIARLVKLPDIDPWTAHHIDMRWLGWFVHFQEKVLRTMPCVAFSVMTQPFRPWRNYLMPHF